MSDVGALNSSIRVLVGGVEYDQVALDPFYVFCGGRRVPQGPINVQSGLVQLRASTADSGFVEGSAIVRQSFD